MRAYYLSSPDEALDPSVLTAEGIIYRELPTQPADYAAPLQQLRDERGYVQMDEIHLGDSTPNLKGLCDKFFIEHLHTDEEIRFVVGGGGIFDLRDKNDAWMRVHVDAGDLIVVPA
ncbi:MAG: acireductone dioxygenase, partial [Myxococcales bacterium]|nr:acireductone dioxygenase [Myxococcales bacterium]